MIYATDIRDHMKMKSSAGLDRNRETFLVTQLTFSFSGFQPGFDLVTVDVQIMLSLFTLLPSSFSFLMLSHCKNSVINLSDIKLIFKQDSVSAFIRPFGGHSKNVFVMLMLSQTPT